MVIRLLLIVVFISASSAQGKTDPFRHLFNWPAFSAGSVAGDDTRYKGRQSSEERWLDYDRFLHLKEKLWFLYDSINESCSPVIKRELNALNNSFALKLRTFENKCLANDSYHNSCSQTSQQFSEVEGQLAHLYLINKSCINPTALSFEGVTPFYYNLETFYLSTSNALHSELAKSADLFGVKLKLGHGYRARSWSHQADLSIDYYLLRARSFTLSRHYPLGVDLKDQFNFFLGNVEVYSGLKFKRSFYFRNPNPLQAKYISELSWNPKIIFPFSNSGFVIGGRSRFVFESSLYDASVLGAELGVYLFKSAYRSTLIEAAFESYSPKTSSLLNAKNDFFFGLRSRGYSLWGGFVNLYAALQWQKSDTLGNSLYPYIEVDFNLFPKKGLWWGVNSGVYSSFNFKFKYNVEESLVSESAQHFLLKPSVKWSWNNLHLDLGLSLGYWKDRLPGSNRQSADWGVELSPSIELSKNLWLAANATYQKQILIEGLSRSQLASPKWFSDDFKRWTLGLSLQYKNF